MQYDAAGRCVVKQLGNGDRSESAFDRVNQVIRLENLKADDSSISTFTYTYDAVGQRTSALELDGSRVSCQYDGAGRLVAEARSGANAYDNEFSYDPVSNRRVKIDTGNPTTYTYDPANQLVTSVDSAGTTNYTFDADGNQRIVQSPTGQLTTYSWGYENELKAVSSPDGTTVTYTYNADGVRARRAAPSRELQSERHRSKWRRTISGTLSPVLVWQSWTRTAM